MLVCILFCANRTRDRGCSAHPVFPAPSVFWRVKTTSKPRAQGAARSRRHIQLSSPGLPPSLKLRRANEGKPRRSLGVAGTGRPSIPETPMIEPRSRGVLDHPPSRVTTALCGAAPSTSLPATNAERLRKGAKRRSNPLFYRGFIHGLLRGACHRAALRADPVARNDDLPDRLQPRLDLRASRFEKRRQRQFFAERFHRLVCGKAGTVGRNLEQDAVGLAKIETAEIKPVDLA